MLHLKSNYQPMKMIFTLFSLFLLFTPSQISAQVSIDPMAARQQTYAPNTAFIKHPAAHNLDAYFSEAGIIHFEIYKCGSKADLQSALTVLRAAKEVESCTEGVVTGDFQAVSVSLKTPQSKTWFIKWMLSAGFKTIKINNNAPVAIETL